MQVSFHIPDAMLVQFDMLAKSQERSRSGLLRFMIQELLQKTAVAEPEQMEDTGA